MTQETLDGKRTVGESLFTVRELAGLLKMSERWVHERTHHREILCNRFGTAVRFDRSQGFGWMARRRECQETG